MEIRLPFEFTPREYQLPLLKAMDNGATRAIIVWHRRGGKDKTCFNYMIKRAATRVGTYFYFLPTYSQAKKVIWENIDNDGFKMLEHVPKQLVKAINNTELKIELINGSIIQLIAADEFKNSGVGTNPIGVVFSEYSITSPDAWKFVSPILAANGGWAIFNFTPRGKNHAWELLQQGKDNEKWFTQLLTVDDTKVISKEIIDEERKSNPEAFIAQEYYCEFTENAGQFFRRIHENTYDGEYAVDESHDYHLGVDLAKYQDYTVITPFDLNTFTVMKQDRFNQIDWNLQKARITAEAYRYNNARIRVDATGVGDPIAEELRASGLNMTDDDMVKFTEVSRMNMLNHLSMLLEQDRIKIPNDDGLIKELESFQYSLTSNGKIRVSAPESLHDDRVMSLALAVKDISEPLGTTVTRTGRQEEFSLYATEYD